MTNKNLLFIVIVAFAFTSCKSSFYYQVYKTEASQGMIDKGNKIAYEDENCIVSYNLWEDGGNMGFIFTNKTNKDIFLNLEQSYFILNDISYNYYQDRVFTSAVSSGVSKSNSATSSRSMVGLNYLNLFQANKASISNNVGIVSSSGSSISYNEQKIVCIPSNTSKIINEYNITTSLIRDCNLLRYPSRNKIRTIHFSKNESPLVFSNRITYALEDSSKFIKFENEFYVTEITNYPEKELIEKKYDEFCGEKNVEKVGYFKNTSPYKFFIKYTKETGGLKH